MRDTFWPNADLVECPFTGSIAVNNQDLMWSDTSGILNTGKAYPATSMTDQGSATNNYNYFGPRFLGVAHEQLSASQVRSTILVDRCWIGPISIDSGQYYQGQMLTAHENSGTNGLVNQQVSLTTSVSQAIGFIFRDTGATVTTVTACLISNVLPKSNIASLAGAGINTAGFTMNDAANIAAGTSTGTKVGTATTQKLGFWNATPVVQPSGAAQGTVTKTIAAMSSTITNTAINTAVGTSTSSWGFNTQANFNTAVGQINAAAVDITALNTQINAAAVDIAALNTLVNTLRANLVTVGIIKGSA